MNESYEELFALTIEEDFHERVLTRKNLCSLSKAVNKPRAYQAIQSIATNIGYGIPHSYLSKRTQHDDGSSG
jgi:hypothetical protein